MKLKDLQAVIPGWNIIYFIREYRSTSKGIADWQRRTTELEEQGRRDIAQANIYAGQRDAALRRAEVCDSQGNIAGAERERKFAKGRDESITKMIESYLQPIQE